MAISVALKKVEENELFVKYSFSSINDQIGLVEINKETGRCNIVKEHPADKEQRLAYCAMWALMRDWRNNKLLDVTYWES
jgi:hypothetical protein